MQRGEGIFTLIRNYRAYGTPFRRRGTSGRFARGTLSSCLAALLLLLALPSAAGAVSTVTSGTIVTDTYSYTGSTETITVPANVTQLTLTVTGAEGGQGGRDSSGTAPPGGYQGVVTGTISVTPGQVLTIGVGQGGANSPDWNACTAGWGSATGSDPNDGVGGTNPIGAYAGGAGGSPGASGCSGYGGSGGAASGVEIGTSGSPTSVATIVGGGSGGSGGSGQFAPTQGQISLPPFQARSDTTSTTGQNGEYVYTACHQVSGEQCDGGGGAGGGGGAQGGSAGLVEFGSGTSDEWFGLGGYPGSNSTGELSGLSAQYSHYSDDNSNGSVVISYSTGAPSAPTSMNGTPGNAQVSLYWSAPSSTGSTPIGDYTVQYATSPYSSWTTAAMCTGTSTSCIVTGLTNGTNYEFEVAAANSIGQGVFSTPSTPIAPSGPPGAPTITSITPSDGSLSVAFSAASSSLSILDYEYSVDDGATWTSSGVTTSPMVVNGLTDGTTYPVEIRAVNSSGAGTASPAVSGTPSALPGAPTITSITPGSDGTSLGIAFVPGYTGGSPITSYQYATSVGAGTSSFNSWTTASGTTSPLTAIGLTSGTTYSVEIRALNSNGAGPASVYVVGATLTVPVTPIITSITPSDSSLQVTYTIYTSANDGGSAISGVDYSLDGGATWVSAGTLADPFTISSLTNGTLYSVILSAANGVGSSSSSSSSSGTPQTIPGAPTQVQASGGATSAQVSWAAPSANGGATVTSYTVSAFAASSGGSAIATCTTSALTCPVSGLTNDATYYFSVVATNAAGAGPPSSPRVTALPVALPGAPTLTSLTAGNSYLSVPFTAGSQDAHNLITGYQYSVDGGVTWQNATGTTSPITVSGLTNGSSYTVELRAMSANGPGAASNSEPGAPYAAPNATANVTTSYVAGSGQVTVSWVAPYNNGAAISSYTVTAFTAPVGGSQSSTCTSATLNCTLTGLSNGTTYYISIQSVNIYSEYSLRSSPLIPVVPGTASSISLSANPTSSTVGGSVTLTAAVTSGATGTVNFEAGGTTIGTCGAVTISSSSAQCVTTALPVGTSTLSAQYSGNSTYASSSSSTSSFTVGAASQSALLITSVLTTFAPSPSNTALLTTSGGSTAGEVTYAVGASANTAGCSVTGSVLTYTSAGSCSVTASMAGNANYNPVSSSATTYSVGIASSSISLSANPTSSTVGGSVTLTAAVTSGATGTVNFEAGATTIGTCGAVTISSSIAQCVTTALPAGASDSLLAIYSGNSDFSTSTSTALLFSVSQVAQGVLTVTSLSGTPGIDLALTTSGGSGTGAVTYTVVSGTAACSQPSSGELLASGAGTCLVTAHKAADSNFLASSSSATTVVFQLDQTVSFSSLSPADARVGGDYTPTASSTSGLSVALSIDASSSSVCSLSAGVISFTHAGPCIVDANQSGDANYLPATQVQLSIQVAPLPATFAPSAPLAVSATYSNGGVVVTWTPPTSQGSTPVTSYEVRAEPGDFTCSTTGATSCTLTGLSSTINYSISVVAFNSIGTSPSASTTYQAAPSNATVPTSPMEINVGFTARTAVISWQPSVTDGGSSIVSYVVSASPGTATCTAVGANTCIITGLTPGVVYHFSVVAVNVIGTSVPGLSKPASMKASNDKRTLDKIHFAFDSYTLTTQAKHSLRKLAATVLKTEIRRLTLSGYTDGVGTKEFNEWLSGQRAKVVGAYLVAQLHRMGRRTTGLRIVGFGVTHTGVTSAADRIVTVSA